jgi:hypothetical protein
MDLDSAKEIYKSLTPAQRYYIRHKEEKKEKAIQYYWENRERILGKKREV